MASDGLNLDELVDFTDQLVSVARSTPKLAKKFLLKEGTKLAKKTKARVKREVGTNHKKPAKYADSPTTLTQSSAESFISTVAVTLWQSAHTAQLPMHI